MAAVSVADQLKVLIDLQGLDGRIYRLQRELAQEPAAAARLKADHQQAVQVLKASEEKHQAVELKRNQMETELAAKESQIQKHQAQLFQLKTNKEYTAMQREIEGLKADRSVLEEEILKLMEEVDRGKGALQAERERLKGKEAEVNSALARMEQESQRIRTEVEQLQAARQLFVPKVDSQILSRYERILQNREGTALVPVQGNACTGCHMVLPPQMINEILMAARLIACESCARLLYIEPNG